MNKEERIVYLITLIFMCFGFYLLSLINWKISVGVMLVVVMAIIQSKIGDLE